jgi:hypothetical protein
MEQLPPQIADCVRTGLQQASSRDANAVSKLRSVLPVSMGSGPAGESQCMPMPALFTEAPFSTL